jgi:hypothetical protein
MALSDEQISRRAGRPYSKMAQPPHGQVGRSLPIIVVKERA